MGIQTSKATCGINRRSLLGTKNALDVVRTCARYKLVYVWGILTILIAALSVGHYLTRQYENEEFPRKHFYIPYYIPLLPILFGITYTFAGWKSDETAFRSEEIEYTLSDMPKKEYLQYRIGDDRTTMGLVANATSAGILATTNIMGPYFRADR